MEVIFIQRMFFFFFICCLASLTYVMNSNTHTTHERASRIADTVIVCLNVKRQILSIFCFNSKKALTSLRKIEITLFDSVVQVQVDRGWVCVCWLSISIAFSLFVCRCMMEIIKNLHFIKSKNYIMKRRRKKNRNIILDLFELRNGKYERCYSNRDWI